MNKRISFKRPVILGIPLLMALISITAGCSKDATSNPPSRNTTGTTTGTKGTDGPGKNEVWIQSMAFTPGSINVEQGTTITWTNKDGMDHTVTSDDGTFDSGNIAYNASFSYMFANVGTYVYHCKIHPSMIATVIVSAPAPPSGY